MRTLRAIGTALGLAVAATLVTVPAQALEPGVYFTNYDEALLLHQHGNDGQEVTSHLSYQEWARLGFPAQQVAPVEYVKYPWSSRVFAVHFFGPDREDWHWGFLGWGNWAQAHFPAVKDAGWIVDSYYTQWDSSPEIFVTQIGDSPIHKLSPAEWAAAGSPVPQRYRNAGFYRYPWSTSIGFVDHTPSGSGVPVAFSEWLEQGSPTPQTVSHVNGEVVWKKRDSSTLYLDSAITGDGFALTHDQWTALGRPAPVTRR